MTSLREQVCDVAVVGGGPAGIAAAVRAAEAPGARRVTLLDEGFRPGGQIWRSGAGMPPGRMARGWTQRLAAAGVDVRAGHAVVDVRRDAGRFTVLAEHSGAAVRTHTERLVIATGARERYLPFPGWTLPNVMGIGGAQALLKAGASFRGKRVVIAGSGPLLLPVAASLAEADARIVLVAEQAPRANILRFAASLWRSPARLAQAATLRAGFFYAPYATGIWAVSAEGGDVLRSVVVTDGMTTRRIACDVLCVGFGLVPNTEVAQLLGCAVEQGFVAVDERQSTTVSGVFCAGEPTGIGGVERSLVEGEIAGLAAAGAIVRAPLVARRASLRRYAAALERAFVLRPELRSLARGDTVVCRCEDVRLRELDATWTARQAKLYTRAGMGACQGRICGAALQCLMGWTSDTVRPPIQPARLSTMLHGATTSNPTSLGAD